MKLIGLVILGLIASVIFYFLLFILVILVLGLIELLPGNLSLSTSEGLVFLLAFFVVVPVSFFLGSFVTGWFSYYEIENKRSLALMAPALYLNLLWIYVAGVGFALDAFIDVNRPGPGFLSGILISTVTGLGLYMVSFAGVLLGYNLRERFANWWYRD